MLYPSPISGLIHSRRLGLSLGINLQPPDGKLCTFDCLYCECGLNAENRPTLPRPTRREVAEALEERLRQLETDGTRLDVITFSGNGEPTAHPDFPSIIADTLRLRDTYCPSAKVTVLSNATLCSRPAVRDALLAVDNNILKLDTVSPEYIRLIDRPASPAYDVRQVIESMKAFHGHCIVQTIFMHGAVNGHSVDNVSEEYIAPWLEALADIRPRAVTIYTIDRKTAVPGLLKATHAELDAIAERVRKLGIECVVGY